MKDAAAKIADKMCETEYSGEPAWSRATIARDIRSAIRRAVKAERERCVGRVWVELTRDGSKAGHAFALKAEQAIQAKATRPSRRK